MDSGACKQLRHLRKSAWTTAFIISLKLDMHQYVNKPCDTHCRGRHVQEALSSYQDNRIDVAASDGHLSMTQTSLVGHVRKKRDRSGVAPPAHSRLEPAALHGATLHRQERLDLHKASTVQAGPDESKPELRSNLVRWGWHRVCLPYISSHHICRTLTKFLVSKCGRSHYLPTDARQMCM